MAIKWDSCNERKCVKWRKNFSILYTIPPLPPPCVFTYASYYPVKLSIVIEITNVSEQLSWLLLTKYRKLRGNEKSIFKKRSRRNLKSTNETKLQLCTWTLERLAYKILGLLFA